MFLMECTRNEEVWYSIPEEFPSWSAFREGSYWVYQNNRTGETDCTYVTGYTSGNYVSGQKPDPIRVDLHFVRNAGIVFASGQVEQADTSWNLIRSHIIQ